MVSVGTTAALAMLNCTSRPRSDSHSRVVTTIERAHLTTRRSLPGPNKSFIQRLSWLNRLGSALPQRV